MQNKLLKDIQLVIFDLDGTLYFKNKIIEGANEAIGRLNKSNINTIFMTNTDSKTIDEIYDKVSAIGLKIDKRKIFNPIVAINNFLSDKNLKVYPLVTNSVLNQLDNVKLVEKDADYVVIGDFRDKVSYENINRAFKLILDGAEIIATQKAKFFYDDTGKNIDTGSFVEMFEYSTGKKSKVFGKPNKEFFDSIIKSFGIMDNKKVAIVGDDINTDIVGANTIGAIGVQVKTGKYNDIKSNGAEPDYLIESVAELANIIKC